jgi:hypothetical protein
LKNVDFLAEEVVDFVKNKGDKIRIDERTATIDVS